MKKFNLNDALNGAKVVTRDGRPVKIAGYNPDADVYYRICGWLDGSLEGWTQDGQYYYTNSAEDLFMYEPPKQKKEGWINLFMHHINGPTAWEGVFTSYDEGKFFSNGDGYIDTIKITWEE